MDKLKSSEDAIDTMNIFSQENYKENIKNKIQKIPTQHLSEYVKRNVEEKTIKQMKSLLEKCKCKTDLQYLEISYCPCDKYIDILTTCIVTTKPTFIP